MNRLAWLVLVLGCGGGSQTSADAGSDVASDVVHEVGVACDFPCRVDWGCTDGAHWVELHTVYPPQCSSGAMCESTGVTHACDPGLECVKDPPSGSKVPCTYGGVAGCMPGDAGSFVPTPLTASPPTRQQNACDQTAMEQYWSRCLDPSTYNAAACTYWQNNYKTCIACLAQTLAVAPWSDNQNPTVIANEVGCYAYFGDTTCANNVDANTQCAAAVCEAGCQLDPQAYAACIEGARKTACSAFPLCDADAGAYATCQAPSFKDFFSAFGEALCGP